MATAGESSEFKKTEFRGCSGDGRTSFRLEIIHRFSPPLFCGKGDFDVLRTDCFGSEIWKTEIMRFANKKKFDYGHEIS